MIEAYKYNFSQPGALTGPLNYYRAAVRYPTKEPQQIIELPTLLIWVTMISLYWSITSMLLQGDNDAALDGAMADKHTTVCSDITIKWMTIIIVLSPSKGLLYCVLVLIPRLLVLAWGYEFSTCFFSLQAYSKLQSLGAAGWASLGQPAHEGVPLNRKKTDANVVCTS